MKKAIKIISAMLLIFLITACTFALAGCNKKPELVEEETVFRIADKSKDEKCKAFMLPIMSFMNKSKCTVTLSPDGTITMQVVFNDSAIALVNDLLAPKEGAEEAADPTASLGGLDAVVKQYVTPLFPGFTLKDIPGSLALLEKSEGLSLVGLDFNDPGIKALCAALAEGKLPKNLVFPAGLGLKYVGTYEIVDIPVKGGGTQKAVYSGPHTEHSEPFYVMALSDNAETGKRDMYMRIEFLNIDLYATEI